MNTHIPPVSITFTEVNLYKTKDDPVAFSVGKVNVQWVRNCGVSHIVMRISMYLDEYRPGDEIYVITKAPDMGFSAYIVERQISVVDPKDTYTIINSTGMLI